MSQDLSNQNILITGGTSGLGLEMVKLFLKEGFNVIATGRQTVEINDYAERFRLVRIDFSKLSEVAGSINDIFANGGIDLLINNAGILSPPEFTTTTDGLEYSFQVNFLSHLLMNEIILNRIPGKHNLKIISVTSPVYRFAGNDLEIETGGHDYNPIRAYASSKLYLTFLGDAVSGRHPELNLRWFSFDPGTFSSSIYRMQKRWFHVLYRLAAPFMKDPHKVANILKSIIDANVFENGMIYNRRKLKRSLPEVNVKAKEIFLDNCYELINPYIRNTR